MYADFAGSCRRAACKLIVVSTMAFSHRSAPPKKHAREGVGQVVRTVTEPRWGTRGILSGL